MICSECYSNIFIRRKLDDKTAQHSFFRKIGVKGLNFSKVPSVLKEKEWYDTCVIEDTGTGESESDTYVIVGFWFEEVCYRHQIIERPFIFTKHV